MIAFAVFFSGFFTICCLQLKQETSRGLEYMGGGEPLLGETSATRAASGIVGVF